MHAGRILLVPGSGLGESMRDHTHSFPGQGVTRGQNESVATGRTLSGHRSTGRSGVSVVWCGLGGARAQLGKGLVCLAYRRSLSPPRPPPLTSCFCPLVLLREEVVQLQEEVHLLRQMKEMLAKDLEESQGGKCSEVLSATELRVQLVQKEQELARAKEALQGE